MLFYEFKHQAVVFLKRRQVVRFMWQWGHNKYGLLAAEDVTPWFGYIQGEPSWGCWYHSTDLSSSFTAASSALPSPMATPKEHVQEAEPLSEEAEAM